MSMWKLELEGFPQQWLDVVGRFEDGQTRVLILCESEKKAENLRFEWYAFKRKLKAAEEDKELNERMYATLPRIRAEVGRLKSGKWALRLVIRDVGESAQALDQALSLSDEEVDELDQEFGV